MSELCPPGAPPEVPPPGPPPEVFPPPALPVAVGFGHVEPGWALALVRGRASAAASLSDDPHYRVHLRLVPAVGDAPGANRDLDNVRLTHRGRLALAVGAVAVGVVLVAAAWSGATGSAVAPRPVPPRVVVHDGDTLWSIARLIAPARDPRDEVSDLRRLNRLPDVALTPGQVLLTR